MTAEGLQAARAGGDVSGAPARPLSPERAEALDAARRDAFVRARLRAARIFAREGRLPAAERAARQVVELVPEHVRARRLLAEVLDRQSLAGEARLHRARADALDPPPPPLPQEPLDVDAAGAVVALLEPEPDGRSDLRPAEAQALLRRRLEVRLPGAQILGGIPADTVPAIRERLQRGGFRAALSVQAERAWCGETVKDGAFALGRLRVATAAGGEAAVLSVRALVEDPRDRETCAAEVLARALEKGLDRPGVRRAVAAGGGGGWSSRQVRALFPSLGESIERATAQGLDQLSSGRVAEAARSFRRALEIDPEDPEARALLAEAESSLAIMHELAGRDPGAWSADDLAAGALDPHLSAERRDTLKRRLAEQRRRHRELADSLAVSESDRLLPPEGSFDALHPSRPPAPQGPRLAQELARRGPIETRALLTPEGGVVARFYFASGASLPLLREEDVDGDGRPDRWTGYEGRERRHLWKDDQGSGAPDLHWVFGPGGSEVQRVETGLGSDRRATRILHFRNGRLEVEEHDTDGDGRIDRRDTYDDQGHVTLSTRDVDGDGRFEVRSRYHRGKLLSRELEDPSLLDSNERW